MPKRPRACTSIDANSFARIIARKGLRGRHESHGPKRNAWFASLRESIWDDLEKRGTLADLDPSEILEWADAYHARTGEWPTHNSGPIPEAPGETWLAVEAALTYGLRELPGGWTILRLLAEHRGLYNPRDPHFTLEQILTWVDAWHDRTGDWPTLDSGEIPDTGGINWNIVDWSLRQGRGGLPEGSSLARLPAAERGAFHSVCHLSLTEEQILAWADAFRERTGRWPQKNSGDLADFDGINWTTIDNALRHGRGGLSSGSSLSRLLAAKRGVFHLFDRPPLTYTQILEWADAFHQRTGEWPTSTEEGAIPEAGPGATWSAVDRATQGRRSRPSRRLISGSLARCRAWARNRRRPQHLKEDEILRWADAHHARHGQWPSCRSGPIPEAPGETWLAVESALERGLRGLAGGSSLTRLLVVQRGIRNKNDPLHLTIERILEWADAFYARTGHWPKASSGPITNQPGETWGAAANALHTGLRGLPGGSSLAQLLSRERGARNKCDLPPYQIPEILDWADLYHARHGTWPNCGSGPIPEAPGETWLKVHTALIAGLRGLPRGSSLAQLLAARRGVRNIQHLAPITVKQILDWAEAFYSRTGRWPTRMAGLIPEAPGENWMGMQNALVKGSRGLPRGSSLARLIAEKTGAKIRRSRRKRDA